MSAVRLSGTLIPLQEGLTLAVRLPSPLFSVSPSTFRNSSRSSSGRSETHRRPESLPPISPLALSLLTSSSCLTSWPSSDRRRALSGGSLQYLPSNRRRALFSREGSSPAGGGISLGTGEDIWLPSAGARSRGARTPHCCPWGGPQESQVMGQPGWPEAWPLVVPAVMAITLSLDGIIFVSVHPE